MKMCLRLVLAQHLAGRKHCINVSYCYCQLGPAVFFFTLRGGEESLKLWKPADLGSQSIILQMEKLSKLHPRLPEFGRGGGRDSTGFQLWPRRGKEGAGMEG